MALYELDGVAPRLADGAWVADSAQVIGRVVLGENASVWFGAVLRGDNEALTVDSLGPIGRFRRRKAAIPPPSAFTTPVLVRTAAATPPPQQPARGRS